MSQVSILWLTLPFCLGFIAYLLPKIARHISVFCGLLTLGYGLSILIRQTTLNLELLDSFGVTLRIDPLGSLFILANALVTLAVLIYSWTSGRPAFFYTQVTILHGSLNAVFVSFDFISLYVALEVISIAAFSLIVLPKTDRTLWIGLRYLFVSNTAMLFYLIGAILIYIETQSFRLDGIRSASPEALAFILLGLLTKGGVFTSGLWLPLTHSEAEAPISALLSGTVINAGLCPLLRCALLSETAEPILRILGVATALLGVGYAIWDRDTKRMLGYSTVSQVGFVLAAPIVGGFYAFSHSIAKASLFLISGNLASRNFTQLKESKINFLMWLALACSCLSIMGLPLLAGFSAKTLTMEELLPWQVPFLTLAALGTVLAMAKLLLVPFHLEGIWPTSGSVGLALSLLVSTLLMANLFTLGLYSPMKMIESLGLVATGLLVAALLGQHIAVQLPRGLETFEHQIGMMSLLLIFLLTLAVQ